MSLPGAGPTKLWQKRHLVNKSDVTDAAGLMAFVLRIYKDLYYNKVKTITRELQAPVVSAEDGEALYTQLSASDRAEYGNDFVDALGRFVGGLLAECDTRAGRLADMRAGLADHSAQPCMSAGLANHTACPGPGTPYCVPFSE